MKFWDYGDPALYRARCPQEYASLLLRYDHHVVTVKGFRGMLITYPWYMPRDDDFKATVLLNPGMQRLHHDRDKVRGILLRHPQAPPRVQDVIDAMGWTIGTMQ